MKIYFENIIDLNYENLNFKGFQFNHSDNYYERTNKIECLVLDKNDINKNLTKELSKLNLLEDMHVNFTKMFLGRMLLQIVIILSLITLISNFSWLGLIICLNICGVLSIIIFTYKFVLKNLYFTLVNNDDIIDVIFNN